MSSSLSQRIPAVLTLGAFLLHGVTLLLFHFRWDKVALATVLPVWVYALIAFALLGVSAFLKRSRWTGIVALVWLISLPFILDETKGIVRSVTGSERPTKERTEASPDQANAPLRIVSLNCKARGTAAAVQVAEWNPDIVFLQEAPYYNHLKKLAEQWYGDDAVLIRSRECAIIARGKRLRSVPVSPVQGQTSPRGVVAQLELLDGRVIELINVHLDHATTKLSVWSRKTWRTHAANRRNRRLSLAVILHHRQFIPQVTNGETHAGDRLPSIVAGDFNAPAGDSATSPLIPDYTDAWREAGVGWGNTFPADLPVHRIDQIWTNQMVTPLSMGAEQLSGTDHQMLVFDFQIQP